MLENDIIPPELFLRYGDCVTLEVTGIEGCEFGGILGSEDIRSSSERFISTAQRVQSTNRRSSYAIDTKEEHEESEPRLLGVSAINDYHGQKKLPSNFFTQNVFQIAEGVGFEAAGQVVRYGAQIRLVLRSTQEFLHSNRQSDLLELISGSHKDNSHLKGCSFKILPRYQVRTDGECVYYKDLIVLLDLLGREVYCTSATTVVLSSNTNQKTGFRLNKFLPHEIATQSFLYGGATLQLFHRDESCFVVASNAVGSALDVDIHSSETTLLETSSSYWQLETIPNGQREIQVSGVIHHGTPVRLRHILLDFYLAVKGKNVILSKEANSETEFEMLLNIDDSSGSTQDMLSNLQLSFSSRLRLRNRMSGRYLTIDKDMKEDKLFISCSNNNADKDVFLLLGAPDLFIETVVQVKKFKQGFSIMVSRLLSDNLPHIEFDMLVEKAIGHLETLLRGTNSLGQLISNPNGSNGKIGYDICNELGLTTILLDIADCAISTMVENRKNNADYRKEMKLGRTAYSVLGKMVSKNVGSVHAIVKCGGVSRMIDHLISLDPSCDWTPPLLELVDTLYTERSKDVEEYLNVLTAPDIEKLLDAVYYSLFAGEVPDEYYYRLLARICKPGNGLISASQETEFVNRNMQLLVCQHVLGFPYSHHHKSPFWSMMTYRTVLHSLGQNKFPEVLISSSVVGQFRPMGLSGKKYPIPRAQNTSSQDCSDEDWEKCVALRNQLLPVNERHDYVLLDDASHPLKSEYDRLSFYIANLQQSIHWVGLDELTENEIGFYCATLQLLSAMCAGRNIWTQRLVRQLLPLDHILLVLDWATKYLMENKKMDHPLVEMQTLMVSVLYYCYIDSANIPVVPNFTRTSTIDQTHLEVYGHGSWDDIFMQECYLKLFSLCSQEDDFLIRVTEDMSHEDLVTVFESNILDDTVQEMSCANPHGWGTSPESKVVVEEVKNLILQKRKGEVIDQDKSRQCLSYIYHSKKKAVAACSVHCLEQRAILMEIVLRFINVYAPLLWRDYILIPSLEFAGPKHHHIYDREYFNQHEIIGLNQGKSTLSSSIQAIKNTIFYMENMFAVIQSLMLRRFFAPSYNVYPEIRFDNSENSKKPRTTSPNGHAGRIKYEYFFSGFNESLYELTPFTANNGDQIMVLRCKGHDSIQIRPGQKVTGQKKVEGDLYRVKLIMECALDLLQEWPGQLLNPKYKLDEDDKLVDDYFRRQFGYIQDGCGICEGTLRLKLQFCKILSSSLDLLHAVTVSELQKIFSPLFESVVRTKRQPLSLEASSRDLLPENMSIMNLMESKPNAADDVTADEHLRKMLSSEEERSFRIKTWALLHEKLERNPDMIWHTDKLFREETLHVLIRLAYDNSEALRGEVLNIIFRINACRSEMSDLMMQEFKISEVDDPIVCRFLSRRKYQLIQMLARFDMRGGDINILLTDDDIRDHILQSYLLKLRHLLLCPPLENDDVGLINFIFLNDFLDMQNKCIILDDQNIQREDSTWPSKASPGKKPCAVSTPQMNQGHLLLPHVVDMYFNPEKLQEGLPNAYHQNLLINMGFHYVLCGFIVNNGEFLEHVQNTVPIMSDSKDEDAGLFGLFTQEYSASQSVPKKENIMFELFRICCMFLKIIMMQNRYAAKAIGSKRLIRVLLNVRLVFPEGVRFLVELLKVEPKVANNITDNQFASLIKDLRQAVLNPESLQSSDIGKLTATKCADLLALVEQIILAEIKQSPHRLNQLVQALSESLDDQSDMIINRILNLGLGLQPDAGPFDPKRYDISYTGVLYRMDTGRMTFSRLPKDIIADAPFDEEIYKKQKKALMTWKLLSDSASMKVHLSFIFLIGSCSQYSISLQHMCKRFFPSPNLVFQALMIDKVEIRIAYLRLLHGLWLSEKQDHSIRNPQELLSAKSKIYMGALLTSIIRDLRLYSMLVQDSEIIVLEQKIELNETLGMLPKQIKLLRDYLRFAVLPFVSSIITLNMHHAFDELNTSKLKRGSIINMGDITVPTCLSLLHTFQTLIAELYVLRKSAVAESKEDLIMISNILSVNVSHSHGSSKSPALRKAIKILNQDSSHLASKASIRPSFLVLQSYNIEEDMDILKQRCLTEFIPEVDRFATKNGYLDVEYLMRTPGPEKIFVRDREHNVPSHISLDPALLASAVGVDPFEIVSNPLNCESFRFLQAKITHMIVAFTQLEFTERFESIRKSIVSIPNRPEEEFGFIVNFPTKDEPLHKLKESFTKLRLIQSRSDPSYKAQKLQEKYDEVVEQFSAAQFKRWTKRGGLLLELIMQHLMSTLQCLEENQQPLNVSYNLNEISRCNEYWTNMFIKGMLRSRMADIYELYADRTETQLALLSIEQERLNLFQDVFESLGAVSVVVKQLSLSPAMLSRSLNQDSMRIVQRMAINFGTSINEAGNLRIQTATIDCAHQKFQLSKSLGRDNSVFQVVRGLIQYYSHLFQHKDGLSAESTADAVKLLRFLSLLCEGHNKKVQEYLGEHRVVAEVANFVGDMNKLLAQEMSQAMITEHEFPSKYFPKVHDILRPLIRWISPLPTFGHNPSAEHDETARVNYRIINIERMTLLSEVITQGLQALAEFCQGPMPEIQMIVARAATTREFKTFFDFFGAFHLHTQYKDNTYKPKQQRNNFAKLYRTSVKGIVTHEAVLESPEKLMWYGSDPLAVNLLVQFSSEKSSGPAGFVDALSDITETAARSLQQLQVLLGAKKKKKRNANHIRGSVSEEAAALSTIEFWTAEKRATIDYRKVKNKATESLEDNWYERISDFGKILLELELSCIKLASSLLEGSVVDEVFEIPKIIINDISEESLVCNMSNFWSRYLSYMPAYGDVTIDTCFEREMAYSYYALVGRVLDLGFDVHLKDLVDTWLVESNIHVNDHIARIEVRTADPTALAVAYFPVPSIIKRYWYRGDIVQLRDEVVFPSSTGTRDSADEKVKNYLKDLRNLIATLRHLESLDEIYAPRSFIFRFMVTMAHNIDRWSTLSFFTTLALNVLLIISVKSNDHDSTSYNIHGETYKNIIPVIGFVHICLVGLSTISYMIMYGWLYVKMGLKENPESEFTIKGYSSSRTILALNQIGLLGHNKAELIGNSISFKVWEFSAALYYFFSRFDTWYYFTLLGCSLAGNLVNPLFFACSLMAVLRMSKLMQYVTRAFTANIDQVIATVLLAVIFMYLFTVISLADTHKIHNKYNFDGQGADGCFSLQSCFRMHLDYGMLQSVFWDYPNEIHSVQGEIFNFGLTFIMQIVIPGLISGIIIDTFSEMRGSKQAVEEDVLNTCFVCNIDREDFETSNVPFEGHIKNDHNMWKYGWFMIYLDEKDKTEFDGIEDYCYEILSRKDGSTRWLPLKMARSLSQMRDKYDLFTIYKKITSLQNSLEKVKGDLKADASSQSKDLRDAIKNDTMGLEKTLTKMLKKVEKKVSQSGQRTPHAPPSPEQSPTRTPGGLTTNNSTSHL